MCAYTVPSASMVATDVSSPASVYQMTCWLAFAGAMLVTNCVEDPHSRSACSFHRCQTIRCQTGSGSLQDRGVSTWVDQGLLRGEHGAVRTGRFHGQRGGSRVILRFHNDSPASHGLVEGGSTKVAATPGCELERARIGQCPGNRREIASVRFAVPAFTADT